MLPELADVGIDGGARFDIELMSVLVLGAFFIVFNSFLDTELLIGLLRPPCLFSMFMLLLLVLADLASRFRVC